MKKKILFKLKKTQETVNLVSQWDQIYEKYRVETAKTQKKKSSTKVNESKKPKSSKKKVTSNKNK